MGLNNIFSLLEVPLSRMGKFVIANLFFVSTSCVRIKKYKTKTETMPTKNDKNINKKKPLFDENICHKLDGSRKILC